jgi:hypothetical protein
MRYFAYFIGGPLDLTKKQIDDPMSHLYALGKSIYTWQEIASPIEPVQHRYIRIAGRLPVQGISADVFVYIYDGELS